MQLLEAETSIELSSAFEMDQRKITDDNDHAHEPLLNNEEQEDGAALSRRASKAVIQEMVERPFSWVVYGIFALLGIAMLWSWNMFLAAAPYFQRRFQDNPWILNHFQPAETSVATLTNLAYTAVLGSLQTNASYPRRILMSLFTSLLLFTILAFSTVFKTSSMAYFGFLMLIIFLSNLSTAAIQNGVYAFVSGFGKKEYTQAIMAGQGIAGVLPPLVQILSVLLIPAKNDTSSEGSTAQSPKAAFSYFITATVVSGVTVIAFLDLLRRETRYLAAQEQIDRESSDGEDAGTVGKHRGERKPVPLSEAFMKVPYLASATVLCYGITMVYTVFATVIQSVSGIDPAIFIPLAFFTWNVGDLIGRMIPSIPGTSLTYYPFALFCMSMARLIFIPLFFLCNIKGRGAKVNSDVFYLVVVQLLFGISNGYIGTVSLMAAPDWVLPEEREAVGGFMALCITIGLTAGSLLSFLLGNI